MAGLLMSFKEVQKFYAVIGAAFIPLLAIALLVMNSRRDWLGRYAYRWPSIALLMAAIIFFGNIAWRKWLA